MNPLQRFGCRAYYTLTGYPWRWEEGKDEFYECCRDQILNDIRTIARLEAEGEQRMTDLRIKNISQTSRRCYVCGFCLVVM